MEMSMNGAEILAAFENVPLLGTVHITQTLIVSWLVMLIISAVCIWLGSGLEGYQAFSRKQAAAEMIVNSLIHFVHGNMGTEFDRYIPLVGTIFVTSLVLQSDQPGGHLEPHGRPDDGIGLGPGGIRRSSPITRSRPPASAAT